jgi:DNA-binding NtrC family response regulator
MIKILLIDDNQAVLNFLRILLLQKERFDVTILQDSKNAFQLLKNEIFDILILDMDMPEVSGLDILKFVKMDKIEITTIVLTGVEDIDTAISAMKMGTFDYILKPIEENKLIETIDTAIEHKKIYSEESDILNKYSYDGLKYNEVFKDIVTCDEKMFKIFYFVEKFAKTENSILISGESGSGKELIAKAIHKISSRKDSKFIAVNAGTFAQELFSSEFFGYQKGAFTGASKDRIGFIEEANHGTLFLDEIGELPLSIQVKLLRVLQEDEFYRLGSTKNIKVDVRIIAATNKNLFEEIKNGNFRKDLFFRLNINSINLPPLRERKEDIKLLANYFLKIFNEKYGKNIEKISKPLMDSLLNYHYPGNVRELMNMINSAIIVESSNELRRKSLPNYFLEYNYYDKLEGEATPMSLSEVEKEHITKVLTFTKNNHTLSAYILGISRVNLIAKIKKYNIKM